MKQLYIGLVSGTSMDAIDAVLVDFSSTLNLITTHSMAIPEKLKQVLWQLIAMPDVNKKTLQQADIELGELFAQAANILLKKVSLNAKDICAIGSHGQTIHHRPNAKPPSTLQIGDANIIMQRTGITTISNFRAADVYAGGQGAPLAPLFHHRFMRDNKTNRAVVNIGGIANITLLPKDDAFI